MTITRKAKVLAALQEGRELSPAQITAQFRAMNPGSLIQSLRFDGFPIYLNARTDTKGRVVNKYRLGRASRAVVAAGYKAIAAGIDV